MKEACPNTFTDPLKLNLLKGCLDKSSQTHLQWCRERNPTITYKDCWAELSRLHGYDVVFQNRKVWQGVRLEKKERRIRKHEVIAFRGNYLIARSRVKGWTPEEDFDVVYSQLDEYWRTELKKEGERRGHGKYWVRVTVPRAVGWVAVREILEDALGLTNLHMVKEERGFLVDCKSAVGQDEQC